jgi:energy-coupling factor transporter ATP-binding protein EcfA2
MSLHQERDDELLHTYGLTRGAASNFGAWVQSVMMANTTRVEFEQSGVTAIVGANNCGKSTFLSQLNDQLNNANSFPQPAAFAGFSTALGGDRSDLIDWLCEHAHYGASPHNPYTKSFSRLGAQLPIDFFTNRGTDDGSYTFQNLAEFTLKYLPAGERELTSATKNPHVLDAPIHPLHYLMQHPPLLDELNAITTRILGKTLYLDDLNQSIQLRVGVPTTPYPARYEDPRKYQQEVEALPLLDGQGDGVRSLVRILLPLITGAYSVVIMDEPELFLHPPQAFALGQEVGRIAGSKKLQVILATHDKNLLAGLLGASAPVSVVRLVRDEETITAHQLRASELRDIWDDPVLKYSNVLDGLFHELVVLAENERDCRFYEAALDVRDPGRPWPGSQRPVPASDVLFIPSAGTSGMPRIASALRALKVPVLASPDLDVLDNETVIRNIVGSLGSEWEDLHDDWNLVTTPLMRASAPRLVSAVNQSLRATMDQILEDPMAEYDASNQRRIKESLGLSNRPWDQVKRHGIDELHRMNPDPSIVDRFIRVLAERGVVLVQAGELESFGHSLGVTKGKGWLPAALRANLHRNAEVQAHIDRLLLAYYTQRTDPL